MRRGAFRTLSLIAAAAVTVGVSACGSGARQDVHEPSGNFQVSISRATFPTSQTLAERTRLTISVRNTGTKTIPNLAVTICNTTCAYPAPAGQGTSVLPFAHYLNQPGLAYQSRPVWVVDQPPGKCGYSCQAGGEGSDFTVGANTWSSGALPPGQTATFTWAVTAVVPGKWTVAWKVAAGIYGKAKAVLSDGSEPRGAFHVNIAHAPAQSYVNDSGGIVKTK